MLQALTPHNQRIIPMNTITETRRPHNNSLSLKVNKAHKSAARMLFQNDYMTSNTIEFEGSFKGFDATAHHKSMLGLNRLDKSVGFSYSDKSRFDFRLQDDRVFRLMLKPTSLLTHLDFSYFNYVTRIQEHDISLWLNPYIQYQTDRSLSHGAVFLGLVTRLNGGLFSNNARVKLQNKMDEIEGEFENNWIIKFNNFHLNWYYSDDIKNFSKNVARKIHVEYLIDRLSIAAELDKHKRGNLFDWGLDTLQLGFAFQHSRDLTYGLWSTTKLRNANATTVTAGLQFRVLDDAAIKVKVDTNQDIGLFANYDWAKGLHIQGSLSSSADAKRLSNVYDDCCKFGLKLKYDSP